MLWPVHIQRTSFVIELTEIAEQMARDAFAHGEKDAYFLAIYDD